MAFDKLDLDGAWQFKEYPPSARRMRDLDTGGWMDTSCPHSIYASLIGAGCLDESELLAHPERFLGISQTPWVFRKTFEITEPITADRVDLVCEGLDTVTQIWLNEKLVARTDNMFLSHRFDITQTLKAGVNTLVIKFAPPLEAAEQRMNRYGRLNTLWGMEQRTYLRKAQFQFGSSYGPALPGCGIHGPIRIEAVTAARIENVHIRTIDCSEQFADLRIAVELDVPSDSQTDLACELEIARGRLRLSHRIPFDHHYRQSAVLRVDNPDLWWPAGCGDPALYTLTVRLLCGGEEVDRSEIPFGIRTLQFAPDSDGSALRFIVNNRPVFIRGAAWFCRDLFLTPFTQTELEVQLREVRDSHINLLRVSASGAYETTDFYRLCDRLGLLVWQDFMFAEAYYPERSWFIDSVKTEAAQVIRRLRSHPSLALWCGNNGIDRLHQTAGLGGGRKFYGKDIYHKLLPSLVRQLDPDRDYIPTTPAVSKKTKSAAEPVHRRIGEPSTADEASTGFIAEAACPSLPDLDTVRQLLASLGAADDPALERLSFTNAGLASILNLCIQQFGLPRSAEDLLFQSQLLQARAYRRLIESCRGRQSEYGGLIWKSWNEFWPAVAPGACDWKGGPKALAWYMKRYGAPVVAVLVDDPAAGPLAVVTNDRPAMLAAVLNVRLMTLDGALLDRHEAPLTMGPFAWATVNLPREMTAPLHPDNCFLRLEIVSDQNVLFQSVTLFLPDRDLCWPAMNIDCGASPLGPREWKLSLQSPSLIKDLIVIPPQRARLSDNCFDLFPGEARDVRIRFFEPAPAFTTPVRFRSSAFIGPG